MEIASKSYLIVLVVITVDGVPVVELGFLDFRSWRSDVSQPFDPTRKTIARNL
jgi:hypothetical protein